MARTQNIKFIERKNKALEVIGTGYGIVMKWYYPDIDIKLLYAFKNKNLYDYDFLKKLETVAEYKKEQEFFASKSK